MGVHKKPIYIYRGSCLKEGNLESCKFKRVPSIKEGFMFLRGVVTPMHTMSWEREK